MDDVLASYLGQFPCRRIETRPFPQETDYARAGDGGLDRAPERWLVPD